MLPDGALVLDAGCGMGDGLQRWQVLCLGDDGAGQAPGHELRQRGQVIGTDVFPFDDAEQASVAVAALDGKI